MNISSRESQSEIGAEAERAHQCVIGSVTEAHRCLTGFLANAQALATVTTMAEGIAASFKAGSKVLVAGNGGSMADAMHFAEELTGRFRKDRRPLPAMALSDPTHLSCVSNDYGYSHVFERMVEAFVGKNDILILLTTSGESENLLLAAAAAKSGGARVYGFLGKSGGRLLDQCDLSIVAPGSTSDRIQEIHMLCLHILVEAIEQLLELA